MALIVRVDASHLLTVGQALEAALQAASMALPTELNNAGHELYHEIVDAVAAEFPEVPPQAIAAAIVSREASGVLPTYVIASADRMVTYLRWVTQRDEKVCKICGPRDGIIYRTIDLMDIWPAHPNCRCRIEQLEISEAMLVAGAQLLPAAMDRVAAAVLAEFARALP